MSQTDLVLVFKAMADETRLKIIKMLSGGERCACSLLEHFDITQPTLSYHMRILCESGLVESRRDGAWMRYNLNKEYLAAIKTLAQELSSGSDNSYNFKEQC